ncbi:MAG: rod shape-determining protein RodA [Candidatus Omnitrophica bacterium]|nr:rod shape-determining protein RodA [Candidatus Omnitrophota bacterium]
MLTWRQLRGIDRPTLFITAALLGIGLLILYSASFQKAQQMGVSYLHRQMVWAAMGALIAVVLVSIDYHRWLEWAYVAYGLNMLLLILVLELGVVRGGAQRWLSVGGLTIQPSEFAKITTALVLARYLGSQRDTAGSGWKQLFGAGLLAGLPMVLILKEPNLGTASSFIPMTLAMLLVWGIRMKVLWLVVGTGIALVPVLWNFLADYQRSRLMVFLNPNLDPLGAGYTVVQSKVAIGSGGWWGKGWFGGTQNQLNFLPERHTDFIFSIVGEEWGFVGTTVCLALFAALFYRALLIATQTRDPFGRLLIVGLMTILWFHVIVNIGMTMGLMPVVGLPLPFLSYGGSWTLTCLVAIGVILSVGVRRPLYS